MVRGAEETARFVPIIAAASLNFLSKSKELCTGVGTVTFEPCMRSEGNSFRMSRKFDLFSLENRRKQKKKEFGVCAAYKSVAKKVRPVDFSKTDGSNPGGTTTWKTDAMAKEKYIPDPSDKYAKWLIPRFSGLAKGSRLTPEKIAMLRIGPGLTGQKRELLLEMLYNREAAITFTFETMGKVSPSVAPPQEIRTIPHKPWQAKGFQIPKALHQKTIDMLKERLRMGVIEPCYGPYRNPWYLVKKTKPGKYQFVNAAVEVNRVTLRDANLPPQVNKFSEEFAGYVIASLVDFFLGYDQVSLATESRNFTGFQTPLGLMRMTTLPQGATNLVAQFVRITCKILADQMPTKALPFMDDVGVKGPKTTYNNEEVTPGIRRYVLEHIQWLDGVLADIERFGCTISGAKSQFAMEGLKMVGYVCDGQGKHPETTKVLKVLDWPIPIDLTEARAFIGICVYYRIWIKNFAEIAWPIYWLF